LSYGARMSIRAGVLPLCTVIDEAAHVEVGRGVALVEISAHVAGPPGGCVVDAGSVVRAREEGRAPPELIAFRAEVDGRPATASGPRGRVAVEIGRPRGSVRFVAVVRGDRFIAVPLASNPAVAQHTRFRATTSSVWGSARVAGVASWTEVGAPIVVTTDPTRDHEPAVLTAVIDAASPAPALIVDAGPALARDLVVATESARAEGLSRGGVEALSILLADVPLAIATAPEPGLVVARLGEAAKIARAASLSRDPLLVAIGQRLATALARGLTTCERTPAITMPTGWPLVPRELVASGVLDDAESGCARVSDLLATNHPDVRVGQEGAAALADAARLEPSALPRIGPLLRSRSRAAAVRRFSARTVAFAALVLAALGVGLFLRERAR